MMFVVMIVVVLQLDNVVLDDVEIIDLLVVVEYIVDGCFVDGLLGCVGLEMEVYCFDLVDLFCWFSWEEIIEVFEWFSLLLGGSVVSVEFGGVVELFGLFVDGVLVVIGVMMCDQVVLWLVFVNVGLGLVFLGVDLLWLLVWVNLGVCYWVMEQFFVVSYSGVLGVVMMILIVVIQVNLDVGLQEGWVE